MGRLRTHNRRKRRKLQNAINRKLWPTIEMLPLYPYQQQWLDKMNELNEEMQRSLSLFQPRITSYRERFNAAINESMKTLTHMMGVDIEPILVIGNYDSFVTHYREGPHREGRINRLTERLKGVSSMVIIDESHIFDESKPLTPYKETLDKLEDGE